MIMSLAWQTEEPDVENTSGMQELCSTSLTHCSYDLCFFFWRWQVELHVTPSPFSLLAFVAETVMV